MVGSHSRGVIIDDLIRRVINTKSGQAGDQKLSKPVMIPRLFSVLSFKFFRS